LHAVRIFWIFFSVNNVVKKYSGVTFESQRWSS
jgi:hypothetical protein